MNSIERWLQQFGLGKYGDIFADNDIRLDVLPDLDQEDLKNLGVSLGDSKRLLRAIETLNPRLAVGDTQENHSPDHAPASGEAERRQLTVMFCDLVGSTALSRRLDPEDLRGLIARYHQVCRQAIDEFDGFVARYMGDGVLAYFGYPRSHEDDAERALHSALALVRGIRELNQAADADGGLDLAVRIGIATGLVVVGDLIGDGASRESPVVGDTPNIAARLQSFAAPDSVVIAESTHRLIGQSFECHALGGQTLNGVTEPIEAWEVIGIGEVESRFEAARRTGLMPLVGRDEELALLLNRWQHIADGDGRVVLICGEAGIGKSRLTEAIRQTIAPTPHTRIRYQCSPHHTNSAFYPLVSQLGRAAGLARQDDPPRKLAKLRDLLRRASQNVEEDLPLIADLMSIPAAGLYVEPRLEPQQRKQQTLDAIIRLLESLASGDRVLCVFEDVHWIDPSTLELLERIVDRCEFLPVLVLVTCRPEFSAPWTGQAHTSVVSLSRMTRRQAQIIAEQIAEHTHLDKSLLDDIVAKTDGIPLFVEELTRAVLDSDDRARVDDRGAPRTRFESIGIPATLQDSLMSRLDKLSVGKPIAQMAAALGREFSHELIAAVAQHDSGQVAAALDELTRSGLVLRRGAGPNASYLFKHALVQDAAYQSMLRSARRHLHGRIAHVLIEQYPEAGQTNPEFVARHCREAGFITQATQYWQRAGDRAAARAAHAEAIEHYSQGLALVGEVDDERIATSLRVAINLGLASSMRVVERREEALRALDRAEAAANINEHAAQLVDLHYLRGNLYFPLGRIDECLSEHEQSRNIARREGLAEKESRALGGMGDAYYQRGRIIRASQLFDACIELSHEHGFEEIEAAHLPMRGLARFFEVRFQEAWEDCTAAASLAESSGQTRAQVVAQQVLSYLLAEMGRYEESIAASEKSMQLSRRLGAANLEASAMTHQARSMFVIGRHAEAIVLARNAYLMIRQSGLAFLGPTVLGHLAWITDLADERAHALREGEALLGRNSVSHNYARFYRFAAEVCLDTGQWHDAERYALALEDYFRPEPLPWCEMVVERARALAAHGRGDRSPAAIEKLLRVRDRAKSHGFNSLLGALESALSPRT